MIIKNKQFTLSDGDAPWTYAFTSGAPGISFDTATGTSENGVIQVEITYDSEDDVSEDIVLLAVDAEGCNDTFTFNEASLCSGFVLGSITQSGQNTFTVTGVSVDCSDVEFEWTYDNTIFSDSTQVDGPTSSQITLTFNSEISSYPKTSSIKVKATYCGGCEAESATFTYDICTPITTNLTVPMVCSLSGYTSAIITIPAPKLCPGAVIDWTTFTADFGTAAITATVTDTVNGKVQFTAPSTVSTGNYTGTYSVETDNGIRTSTSNIDVTIYDCATVKPILIGRTAQRQTGQIVTDLININIESDVVSKNTLDWSTWQLVTPPTTTSPSVLLKTNIDGDHYFEYEIPALTGTDSFAYTIADSEGNYADSQLVCVILDDPSAPTANADADNCPCGGSVDVNVLSNDTGGGAPLDISSVTITAQGTNGIASVNPDGTIKYTPNAGFVGVDTFDYEVSNTWGTVSGTAVVTVTVDEVSISLVQTAVSCDYTITVGLPSNPFSQAVEWDINGITVAPKYRKIITGDCKSGVLEDVTELGTSTEVTTDYDISAGGDVLVTGGWLELIAVQSTTFGTFLIPLAPSGSNIAVFSGVGGTTNATDLTYNSASPGTFATALGIAIRNYLGTVGYSDTVDYELGTINVTAGGVVTIPFKANHQPTLEWLGIDVLGSPYIQWDQDGATPRNSAALVQVTTSTIPVFVISFAGAPTTTYPKCGAADVTTNILTVPYDTPNLNYDAIPLTASTSALTFSVTTNQTRTCSETKLDATTTDCFGATWLWTTTGETEATIWTDKTGAFVAEVTCPDGCTGDNTIVV